jgi:hypothetical protein
MPNRPALTIAEAVEALSVSDKTIRRMLKEGLLREQARDIAGRILIDPQSIEVAAAQLGRKEPHWPETTLTPVIPPAADPLQQVANAFADLLHEKDERIYSLQEEIAELRAEQKYLPRMHEAEQARVRELEQALSVAQTKIAQLEAVTKPGETTGQGAGQQEQSNLMRRIRRVLRLD